MGGMGYLPNAAEASIVGGRSQIVGGHSSEMPEQMWAGQRYDKGGESSTSFSAGFPNYDPGLQWMWPSRP